MYNSSNNKVVVPFKKVLKIHEIKMLFDLSCKINQCDILLP